LTDSLFIWLNHAYSIYRGYRIKTIFLEKVWIYCALLNGPGLNCFNKIQVCTEKWPDPKLGNIYFVVAHLILCYLLPLALITICYTLILRRVSMRKIPQETKNLSTELLVQRFVYNSINILFNGTAWQNQLFLWMEMKLDACKAYVVFKAFHLMMLSFYLTLFNIWIQIQNEGN
jgi:hypothetical protein